MSTNGSGKAKKGVWIIYSMTGERTTLDFAEQETKSNESTCYATIMKKCFGTAEGLRAHNEGSGVRIEDRLKAKIAQSD